MLWFERLRRRLRNLFGKKKFEQEMDEELRFHFESLVQDNVASGMSPVEARRTARLRFGGVDQIKEDCRDTCWTRWLDEFGQDLRHALRMIARDPFSAVITIILISATIGLMCASYAVLDAVVLRTLPVPHPEQLVVINQRAQMDSAVYDVLERERQNISQIFGVKSLVSYGSAGNVARSLMIYMIKGDYFGAVGAAPQLGRLLGVDEHEPIAVISDRLWRKEFAAASDVIGRDIKVGSSAFTIVGVARPDFIPVEEPYSEFDVIVPSDMFARLSGVNRVSLQIVARLKAGTRAEKYEAQLNALWPNLLRSTLPPKTTFEEWSNMAGPHAQVESISRGINYVLVLNPAIPLAIQMIFGLSLFIFLSGCLALVLLAIARSVRKQQQTSILMALGGGRWRVQRPFFLETLILSGLGCALGLVIALWWSDLSASFLPYSQSINWRVRIDAHGINLALIMMLFIIMIISSTTMLYSLRGWSTRILHSGNPSSRPSVRFRMVLLTIQLAISFILVHYALFFNFTFYQMLRVPSGFDPENLHVYTLLEKLPKGRVPAQYLPTLIAQIQQLPGVESAAISISQPPMAFPMEYKQPVKTDDGRKMEATVLFVSPGYLRSLHLPLLLGRDLSWSDRNVAIVNVTLMNKLFPNQDPLKHTIAFAEFAPPFTPLQIIGVAGKMTYFGPRWGDSNIIMVSCGEELKPDQQGFSLMVRSKRNLKELGRAIQSEIDPLGVHYIEESVDQKTHVANSMQEERMLATIAISFGILIMLLVGVELYAFCNYLLSMRTKELAIRASVGAAPFKIAAALIKEIVKALVLGLVVGLILTFISQRFLSSRIPNIHPNDIRSFMLTAIVIGAFTMSAVFIPIWHAIRINVAKALRVD